MTDNWQATAAGLAQDLSNLELLEQWKSFALSMWGEMQLCNDKEKCIKEEQDPKCPCDYYKKLVLNK